jgi:hypothetical protein
MPVAPELLPDAAKALVFDCDGEQRLLMQAGFVEFNW